MLLTSCASKIPDRNFEVQLYLIKWQKQCLESKETGELCGDKKPFVIGITPEDYKKERDYQDEIKNVCR